jgi:glycosyltransferase involved in cell wall biosynthesis
MLESFSIAFKTDTELRFIIIGDWDKNALAPFLNKYNKDVNEAIKFVDSTNHLHEYLNQGALYLHCARGEAFGITVLIAMLAGLPSIVSEWTGAKEAVEQVSLDLVVTLKPDTIAQRITWYFNLSANEKKLLSDKSREIAENYTEEKSIKHYQHIFKQITSDLGLTKPINTSNY